MNEQKKSTVILVDDHPLYRAGLRATLEKASIPLEIIGECASGAEFRALLDISVVPDLVLLDIFLPDTTGIEIARSLKIKHPETRIIALSSEVSEDTVSQLLEIGVDGYLSKAAQMSDLENAIMTIISGNHYYGQSVSKIMYDVYVAKNHILKNTKKFCSKKAEPILTNREVEIVRCLCNGYSAKETADALTMSVRTVETHKSNILKKLGFNNVAEIIRYAVKNKIVVWE